MCMIEAQSFGLPIISFDYETGPYEIIDDSINGILVENGNIELMAEKLKHMIEDKQYLQNFQSNIKDNNKFNLDSIINKWESMLDLMK